MNLSDYRQYASVGINGTKFPYCPADAQMITFDFGNNRELGKPFLAFLSRRRDLHLKCRGITPGMRTVIPGKEEAFRQALADWKRRCQELEAIRDDLTGSLTESGFNPKDLKITMDYQSADPRLSDEYTATGLQDYVSQVYVIGLDPNF